MATPPRAVELTRRVLLGLEACLVVLATLHSAHASMTAGRLQLLHCAMGSGGGDDCGAPPHGQDTTR